MSEKRAYFTLKGAAQALGVHQQTLRNWERRGLIRMVRLPGSGYRRVPAEEVTRLENEMATSTPGSGVQIIPYKRDAESLAEAHVLADTVRGELADLESNTTFDEFISSLRGRTWSQ